MRHGEEALLRQGHEAVADLREQYLELRHQVGVLLPQHLHHVLGGIEGQRGRGLLLVHGDQGRVRGVQVLAVLPLGRGAAGYWPQLQQRVAERVVHALGVYRAELHEGRADVGALGPLEGEQQLGDPAEPHPQGQLPVLVERAAHGALPVGEGEQVEHAREEAAAIGGGVADALEKAAHRVLEPHLLAALHVHRIAVLPPAHPAVPEVLAEALRRGEGLVRCLAVPELLEEHPLEPEDLGLVVGRKVLEVGSVDQVHAAHELPRHVEVRLGLLSDLDEGLLHLHGEEAVHLVEHAHAELVEVLPPRHARQLIHAPRLVAVTELMQLRLHIVEGLECVDNEVVHVVAPHQEVVPPRHAVPRVGGAQPPGLEDILQI
mmetsp:Transcript_35300/g.111552  ORF Transcript_35300/g.111552 Transcript_35300/m.111552 type:complete len:375 (-) Transcript_35300:1314-2438(-)